MTDPEALKKGVDETFSKVKPNVKEDYGDKYLKRFNSFLTEFTDFFSENVDAVTDALDDAISLLYPNAVYKPARNFCFAALFYVAERIPCCVTLMVAKLYTSIRGFPKPREAENYL